MRKMCVILQILRQYKITWKKIKAVSIYPCYHPTTRKKANYDIENEMPCLAPYTNFIVL